MSQLKKTCQNWIQAIPATGGHLRGTLHRSLPNTSIDMQMTNSSTTTTTTLLLCLTHHSSFFRSYSGWPPKWQSLEIIRAVFSPTRYSSCRPTNHVKSLMGTGSTDANREQWPTRAREDILIVWLMSRWQHLLAIIILGASGGRAGWLVGRLTSPFSKNRLCRG